VVDSLLLAYQSFNTQSISSIRNVSLACQTTGNRTNVSTADPAVPNKVGGDENRDRNWDARPSLYDQNGGRYDRRVTVFAISGRRRATPATQVYFSKLIAGFSTTEYRQGVKEFFRLEGRRWRHSISPLGICFRSPWRKQTRRRVSAGK